MTARRARFSLEIQVDKVEKVEERGKILGVFLNVSDLPTSPTYLDPVPLSSLAFAAHFGGRLG
jgi:hypothetical protein